MTRAAKTFHILAIFSLIFAAHQSSAEDSLEFNSEKFKYVWTGTTEKARVIEFIPDDETLETWTRIVTYQCHPTARSLKEVVGPYYKARESIVALRPEVFENKKGYREDSTLHLILGAPGQTEDIEFVLARFMRDSRKGVYAVIYVHRFPISEKVDVSVAMRNKDAWIAELSEFNIQAIEESCRSHEISDSDTIE